MSKCRDGCCTACIDKEYCMCNDDNPCENHCYECVKELKEFCCYCDYLICYNGIRNE